MKLKTKYRIVKNPEYNHTFYAQLKRWWSPFWVHIEEKRINQISTKSSMDEAEDLINAHANGLNKKLKVIKYITPKISRSNKIKEILK